MENRNHAGFRLTFVKILCNFVQFSELLAVCRAVKTIHPQSGSRLSLLRKNLQRKFDVHSGEEACAFYSSYNTIQVLDPRPFRSNPSLRILWTDAPYSLLSELGTCDQTCALTWRGLRPPAVEFGDWLHCNRWVGLEPSGSKQRNFASALCQPTFKYAISRKCRAFNSLRPISLGGFKVVHR
jgi:hypothetical protein